MASLLRRIISSIKLANAKLAGRNFYSNIGIWLVKEIIPSGLLIWIALMPILGVLNPFHIPSLGILQWLVFKWIEQAKK